MASGEPRDSDGLGVGDDKLGSCNVASSGLTPPFYAPSLSQPTSYLPSIRVKMAGTSHDMRPVDTQDNLLPNLTDRQVHDQFSSLDTHPHPSGSVSLPYPYQHGFNTHLYLTPFNFPVPLPAFSQHGFGTLHPSSFPPQAMFHQTIMDGLVQFNHQVLGQQVNGFSRMLYPPAEAPLEAATVSEMNLDNAAVALAGLSNPQLVIGSEMVDINGGDGLLGDMEYMFVEEGDDDSQLPDARADPADDSKTLIGILESMRTYPLFSDMRYDANLAKAYRQYEREPSRDKLKNTVIWEAHFCVHHLQWPKFRIAGAIREMYPWLKSKTRENVRLWIVRWTPKTSNGGHVVTRVGTEKKTIDDLTVLMSISLIASENDERTSRGLSKLRQGEWAEFLQQKKNIRTNHHTLTRRVAHLCRGSKRLPNVTPGDVLALVKRCGGPWRRPEWSWYFGSETEVREDAASSTTFHHRHDSPNSSLAELTAAVMEADETTFSPNSQLLDSTSLVDLANATSSFLSKSPSDCCGDDINA